MRIAFDHQIFGWQRYGGISRYIFETASWLAKEPGNHVSIIAPFYVNEYLKEAKNRPPLWGLPVRSVPRTGRVIRYLNKSITKPLMNFVKPDIIHETYYASTGLSHKSAKNILTVYDMIHERYPDDFRQRDTTRKDKAAAVKRADHVICISKNTQNDLINLLGVQPEKTSVVYLGTNSIERSGHATTSKREKPYLLYVGQRAGYKNFKTLLETFAASDDMKNRFDLICFGGGKFNNSELQQIARLGVSTTNVIQTHGNDEKLARLYANATAFVYPSLYEGFGIPPLEAMRHGCPVICSDTSSIPEVVGEAGCYFDPSNHRSLKDAIDAIISNEQFRGDIIARGFERAKDFTWEECARNTLDVYAKVLRG